MQTWARNIRELRLRRGLTQAALARRVGTTQAMLSHWESGISTPNIEQAHLLAREFGVLLDMLASADCTGISDGDLSGVLAGISRIPELGVEAWLSRISGGKVGVAAPSQHIANDHVGRNREHAGRPVEIDRRKAALPVRGRDILRLIHVG